MVEYILDEEGNIQAFIGYLVFNEKEQLSDDGILLYVDMMVVSKSYKGKNVVEIFAQKLYAQYPKLVKAVWYRDIKYKDNKLREFNFLRLLGR